MFFTQTTPICWRKIININDLWRSTRTKTALEVMVPRNAGSDHLHQLRRQPTR